MGGGIPRGIPRSLKRVVLSQKATIKAILLQRL